MLHQLSLGTLASSPLLRSAWSREPGAAADLGGPNLGGPRLGGPNLGGPRRVVFFLQNQGMEPATCIPKGLQDSCSLAGHQLPEPISPLEPFKEKLHIISGLHGLHTSPSHSAFFGALGGYRGVDGSPPLASTVDYELSRLLPHGLLPHLCIGMDSLESMRAKPTLARLSASGAGKPIFMHSNPNHLYQMIFGALAEGDLRSQYEARSSLLTRVQSFAEAGLETLPAGETLRYGAFVDGVGEVNRLRESLASHSDHLVKFAPKIDELYANPLHETDWHDRLFDLGISALKSGITNVLTVGSGRGEIFGSWKGLGITEQGHNHGHMKQPDNPIWIKIRQYNCQMLVKLMVELESVPEGSGTMMDNTLIVYTSNNADKQHTSGANWPMVLIGDCGGVFKTGCYTRMTRKRPINALYASLLQTAGAQVSSFNLSKQMQERYDHGNGILAEILA